MHHFFAMAKNTWNKLRGFCAGLWSLCWGWVLEDRWALILLHSSCLDKDQNRVLICPSSANKVPPQTSFFVVPLKPSISGPSVSVAIMPAASPPVLPSSLPLPDSGGNLTGPLFVLHSLAHPSISGERIAPKSPRCLMVCFSGFTQCWQKWWLQSSHNPLVC